MMPFGVCVTGMNEKLRNRTLNDAFKRFQRLPMLPPKGDMDKTRTEKPAWQLMQFGIIGNCVTNSTPTLQALAE